MIVLEKLYESADEYLGAAKQDWQAFTNDFRSIFEADFVLYRPTDIDGVLAWRSLDQLIATTQSEYADRYVEHRIFEANQIPDTSLNPLEPNRRSDIVADEQFERMDIATKFFIPRGIFYMLAVSAVLADDSYLVLVAWRNKENGDFSDIEKQRLALFMRYLATLVKTVDSVVLLSPDKEIKQFGKKYKLTEAEIEILSALLQGHSLKMISAETKRKYSTVRWHVQNILEKCHVKTQRNLLSEFYQLIKR